MKTLLIIALFAVIPAWADSPVGIPTPNEITTTSSNITNNEEMAQLIDKIDQILNILNLNKFRLPSAKGAAAQFVVIGFEEYGNIGTVQFRIDHIRQWVTDIKINPSPSENLLRK